MPQDASSFAKTRFTGNNLPFGGRFGDKDPAGNDDSPASDDDGVSTLEGLGFIFAIPVGGPFGFTLFEALVVNQFSVRNIVAVDTTQRMFVNQEFEVKFQVFDGPAIAGRQKPSANVPVTFVLGLRQGAGLAKKSGDPAVENQVTVDTDANGVATAFVLGSVAETIKLTGQTPGKLGTLEAETSLTIT